MTDLWCQEAETHAKATGRDSTGKFWWHKSMALKGLMRCCWFFGRVLVTERYDCSTEVWTPFSQVISNSLSTSLCELQKRFRMAVFQSLVEMFWISVPHSRCIRWNHRSSILPSQNLASQSVNPVHRIGLNIPAPNKFQHQIALEAMEQATCRICFGEACGLALATVWNSWILQCWKIMISPTCEKHGRDEKERTLAQSFMNSRLPCPLSSLCQEQEGDKNLKLISPCKCEGSQKYIHVSCLRKWQRTVLLGDPSVSHSELSAAIKSFQVADWKLVHWQPGSWLDQIIQRLGSWVSSSLCCSIEISFFDGIFRGNHQAKEEHGSEESIS